MTSLYRTHHWIGRRKRLNQKPCFYTKDLQTVLGVPADFPSKPTSGLFESKRCCHWNLASGSVQIMRVPHSILWRPRTQLHNFTLDPSKLASQPRTPPGNLIELSKIGNLYRWFTFSHNPDKVSRHLSIGFPSNMINKPWVPHYLTTRTHTPIPLIIPLSHKLVLSPQHSTSWSPTKYPPVNYGKAPFLMGKSTINGDFQQLC